MAVTGRGNRTIEQDVSGTETDPLVSDGATTSAAAAASSLMACVLAGGIFCFSPVPTCLVVFTEKKIVADPLGFSDAVVGTGQSLLYLGWSLSAVFVLPMSDRIGRKPVLLTMVPIGLFAVTYGMWTKEPVSYEVSLFVVGALATAGQVAFVLALESVPASWRSQVTVGLNSMWSIVLILMALACGYETHDMPWRQETTLWYSPFAVLTLLTAVMVKETLDPATLKKPGNENAEAHSPIARLFSQDYRGTTLCTCWTWVAAALAFFGLTFASGSLSPNPYLNVALFGIIDIVSCFLGGFFMERLGPTRVQSISFALGGAILLSISTQAEGSLCMMVGALAGRFFIDIAFMAIFRLVVEHFPMDCRATALGMGNFVGRMAAMAAPFCMVMPASAACSLMGCACLCASVASYNLPPVGAPSAKELPSKKADNSSYC